MGLKFKVSVLAIVVLIGLIGAVGALGMWGTTIYYYYDCTGDGIADCYKRDFYYGNSYEPWNYSPPYVSGCTFMPGLHGMGTPCPTCFEYMYDDPPLMSVPFIPGPSATPAAPSTTPAIPATPGTIQFGGYSLKSTNLIKCASVQERPYTAMIVRAVDGKSWLHLPEVLLDSGADISILPISIAGILGIDLSDCETRQYHGVGGGVVLGYLTEVQIGITHLGGIDPDIDGYILAKDGEIFLPVISVAFADDDSNYILGRTDVFDLFDLDFTSDTVMIQVAD